MTVKYLVASLILGLSGAASATPELPRHADLDLKPHAGWRTRR